jgi:hypothetical protein
MKTRSALLAAMACGAAAIVLVGLDLAFNVDATLEAKDADGNWATISTSSPGNYARPIGCGNDFRLSVHNGMPWATKMTVAVQPFSAASARPMEEAWPLAAGETRTWEFHLNGTATPAGGSGLPSKGVDSVQVTVGRGILLYATVCARGAA